MEKSLYSVINFCLSENVFQIYFSLCTSEELFKNPEKDTTGVVKTVIKIIQKYCGEADFLLNVRSKKCFLDSFALI